MCINLSGAYDDDKRNSLNSLLRVKTPFPKRTAKDEMAIKVGRCACIPFQLLEGVCMMGCGAILWPIPCTVCKIETTHHETDVSIENCHPSCRTPNTPCHFEDEYYSEIPKPDGKFMTKRGTSKGYSMSCSIGQPPRPEVKIEGNMQVNSTLTGYQCLSSGVGKVISTLYSMLCCPVACVSLACCDEENSNKA